MLKAGFVGVGSRARGHLRALDTTGKVRVVAVADVVFEAAERVARERGARAYAGVAQLLEGERVDVVYTAVPYHVNADVALPVLEAKIPLFMEKTVAVRPEDIRRVAAAAERAGVPTAVGYQWRYLNTVDRLRERVAPESAALLVGQYFSGAPRTRWGRELRFYAGQVFAQLTHVLDLSRFLAGDAVGVQAMYGRRIWPEAVREPEFDSWDVHALNVQFASGAVGSYHCTYGLGGRVGPGEVVELKLVSRDELWTLTGSGLRYQTTQGQDEAWPRDVDPVLRLHQTFIEAIESGRPELVRSPVGDAARSALVCAAANRAAADSGACNPAEL